MDFRLEQQLIELVEGRWPPELEPPGREAEQVDGMRNLLARAPRNGETARAVEKAVERALDLAPGRPSGLEELLGALTMEGASLRTLDLKRALRAALLKAEDLAGTSGRWGDLVAQLARTWIELAPDDEVETILVTLPMERSTRAGLLLLAARRRFPDRALEAIDSFGADAAEVDVRDTLRFFLAGPGGPQRARACRVMMATRLLPSRLQSVMRSVLRELGHLPWSRDGSSALRLPRFGTSSLPVAA